MEPSERISFSFNAHAEAAHASVVVVIVNSRGAKNPWFLKALASARGQFYPNCGVMVVDNNDHGLSIGAAWNLAAQSIDAKYLLFVGDDDYISIDLVSHLAGTIESLRKRPEMQHLCLVTSYCTMVDRDDMPMAERKDNGAGVFTQGYVQLHHTGMYLREWLLDNPFNEKLERHVSTDMQRRIATRGTIINALTMWATSYHYGYHYRNHLGMVSGPKVVIHPPSARGTFGT